MDDKDQSANNYEHQRCWSFKEGLLYARIQAKHVTWIISFNCHTTYSWEYLTKLRHKVSDLSTIFSCCLIPTFSDTRTHALVHNSISFLLLD
jgi:hypothetical protein